ncbi:MAG: NADH-quinone oxidoreductase subunit J [Anaerolineae bacterium]|nr:NADH-quinone oxidoreductase subunit J [Anaerolineae bacterium]
MGLQQILFIIFGTIALGAAVAAVVLRNAFHSALALAGSCLGVAGLLVSLGAPIVAGLQALVFIGGIAALIRFGPAPLREMTRPNQLGHDRWWWAGVAVAAALCAAIVWMVFSTGLELAPDPAFIPSGSIEALGVSLVSAEGFVLPLVVAVLLLGVALAGAARLARRR